METSLQMLKRSQTQQEKSSRLIPDLDAAASEPKAGIHAAAGRILDRADAVGGAWWTIARHWARTLTLATGEGSQGKNTHREHEGSDEDAI